MIATALRSSFSISRSSCPACTSRALSFRQSRKHMKAWTSQSGRKCWTSMSANAFPSLVTPEWLKDRSAWSLKSLAERACQRHPIEYGFRLWNLSQHAGVLLSAGCKMRMFVYLMALGTCPTQVSLSCIIHCFSWFRSSERTHLCLSSPVHSKHVLCCDVPDRCSEKNKVRISEATIKTWG